MSRPTTKPDLVQAANEQFDKLWTLINTMPDDERTAPFNFGDDPKKKEAHWKRDKNIRDVIVHLYEWHQLLLNWIEANKKGRAKPFLPEPYTWKTYGDMNVEFWKKHQSTAYAEAEKMLLNSHKEVLAVIELLSYEELFAKNYFNWTGTSTVGSYCVSVTSSHYDWAIKKLRQHIKTYN